METDKSSANLNGQLIVFQARPRVVMTDTGAAIAEVTDVFTERLLDLHWEAVAMFFTNGDEELLETFRGIEIDGHRLASSRDAVGACLRWAGG